MTTLVTGATGQDGMILSHYLRQASVDVVAVVRPRSDVSRLLRFAPGIRILECDLADHDTLARVVREAAPSCVFHLGGITSPTFSIDNAELTWHVNVGSLAALLSGLRNLVRSKAANPRIVFACSSTIFEGVKACPQNEETFPAPLTPYSKSKAEGLRLIREARDGGLFASSAVLYNHESPLRGTDFVAGKVAAGVARIAAGIQESIHLGDLNARRDWGWAPDYVVGMQLMIKARKPNDWILATGATRSVRDLLNVAFAEVGINDWQGLVASEPALTRSGDSTMLVGDSSRAREDLGWRTTMAFGDIVRCMVKHQLTLLKDPRALWPISGQ